MKKLYLIPAFFCFITGIIKANASYTNYFPSCFISVTASTPGTSGTTICLGASVPLIAAASGGTAPYTYLWTPGAGLNNPTIANPVATPTVTTTYTVNVTDYLGCTGSASVTITVNQPPVANPDTLLLQYLTGHTLSATGGVPPYTYTFSPSVSSSELLSLPVTPTTFTITITGANGCSSIEHANYLPLASIESCGSVYMSEYINDTLPGPSGLGMNDAIELYNPTAGSINLNTYYLTGTTNGSLSAPPFIIQLHGTIAPYSTFLIANTHANTSLKSKASMLSDSLTFTGRDIIALAKVCISLPNVTFSFLDEVGAISPLPTDSGWAVGTGSTKNHTLVRHAYVTQGTLNWNTCKTEWRVCSQGTFSHIGLYNNKCTPNSPDLLLTIANPTLTCGSSQYLEFDVMASSNVPTYFDNCLMDIQYSGTAFGDNVVTNGNVTITKGANFNNATYFDPNSNAGDNSPDTLNIAFGVDLSQPSWTRTQIDAIPQQLIHVKMKIQDCGVNAGIYYTDLGFTKVFSEYTENASDSLQYNIEYDTTYHTGSCNQVTCTPQIINFNAPIDAGIGDVLIITGDNFGNTRGSGQVKFFDADTANYHIQRMNTVDYLSWSNNQIQIRLPAFVDSDFSNRISEVLTVGGGKFIVKNSCGDSAMSGVNANSDSFSVYYNINQSWNTLFSPKFKTENLLRKTDSNGGYVLRFDSVTFPKHSIQRLIFTRAMRDWTCYTGMNWTVGTDTTFTYIPGNFSANTNYVFFTSLPRNAIAETDINHVGCYDSIAIVKGAVTYFNTNASFIYDTTGTMSIPLGDRDFYGVCLHELGHFIELGHSTDSTSLMYWTANVADYRSIPAANRITLIKPTAAAAVGGGLYSVHQSITISSLCNGFPAMTGEYTSCVNPTSISNIQRPNSIFSIYPNPSQGIFTIQSNINDYTLVIINMLGQQILSRKIQNEKSVIDISTQPNGMYFILEQYTNGMASQKLIISK